MKQQKKKKIEYFNFLLLLLFHYTAKQGQERGWLLSDEIQTVQSVAARFLFFGWARFTIFGWLFCKEEQK